MFPFQYVRELVVHLRGLPGASGYGSTTTAEQVTEGLDLQAYTAIVTGKVQQNRKKLKINDVFLLSLFLSFPVFVFVFVLFLFLILLVPGFCFCFFGDGTLCWRL
jgi:hypothetical protein